MGDNNLLSVLMREKNMTIQQAADHAGEMLRDLMDNFQKIKTRLPFFKKSEGVDTSSSHHPGRTVDDDVRDYVESLEYWMVGNIYWSFATQRYFGAEHKEVECTLVVKLKDSSRCEI